MRKTAKGNADPVRGCQNQQTRLKALLPRLVREAPYSELFIIFRSLRKWRWLILGGLVFVSIIGCWPWITAWLKSQFPGKTKWDYIEKIFIPIAPPAAIGFGVWFLDKSAKDRECQREENENKNQALQIYFERISAVLLDKQVISLAKAAKKLGPDHTEPLVESARHVFRAQTLAILRIFSADEEKKSSVVRFLIESEILSSLTVSLSGADLIGAKLIEADLSWADLQDLKWDDKTTWPSADRFKRAKNIPADLKQKAGL